MWEGAYIFTEQDLVGFKFGPQNIEGLQKLNPRTPDSSKWHIKVYCTAACRLSTCRPPSLRHIKVVEFGFHLAAVGGKVIISHVTLWQIENVTEIW